MKVLVLNCGSSSLKFQLIETAPEKVLAKGLVEKIGAAEGIVRCQAANGASVRHALPVADHRDAAESAFAFLLESGVIAGPLEIEGAGHRMVHGGERFHHSALIGPDVIRAIEDACELAPLHNPPNLKGYHASRHLLPHAPQVAVFDTAFHHTLPEEAYLYAIPLEYHDRLRIRRYGFHGISHRYVSERFREIAPGAARVITCHLGNGCSITAIENGRSVENSLGFTPMEGLMMGTRSGDMDPGILLHLIRRLGHTPEQVEDLLNRSSGLAGVSGLSNDMRDLLAAAASGHHGAELAVKLFCYRVRKYIGAYMAVLGGADAVVFTGGIGENAHQVRARICERLAPLGVLLDHERNESAAGSECRISSAGSPVAVWVVPTNEELLIARDTARIIAAGARE